jgi:hypothetical protein
MELGPERNLPALILVIGVEETGTGNETAGGKHVAFLEKKHRARGKRVTSPKEKRRT